jgi:hypothetical protein
MHSLYKALAELVVSKINYLIYFLGVVKTFFQTDFIDKKDEFNATGIYNSN